jgi:hypothetical protein
MMFTKTFRAARFFACRVFGTLLVTVLGVCTADAGPMYIFLYVDPPTTAGAGIPASNGMTVSSSKAGPGTFHLYVGDTVSGSFGIKSYNIKLTGTLTTFINRSPNGNWNDAGETGPFPQGFNDIRAAVAVNGTTTAGQAPTNSVFIGGYGSSAGDFVAANPSAVSTTQSTSGQWGTYADPDIFSVYLGTRKPVFLADGNYTGARPGIDLATSANDGGTLINYFIHNLSVNAQAASATSYFAVVTPEPAAIVLLSLAVVGMGGLVGRRRC